MSHFICDSMKKLVDIQIVLFDYWSFIRTKKVNGLATSSQCVEKSINPSHLPSPWPPSNFIVNYHHTFACCFLEPTHSASLSFILPELSKYAKLIPPITAHVPSSCHAIPLSSPKKSLYLT